MFVGATFCSVAAGEPHPGRAAVMIVTVMTKASRTTSFLTSLPSMAPDYWLYVCSGSTSFRLPKPVQDECQYPGKCARLSVYALLRGVLRVSPTPEPRYRCSDHGGRDHIPSFLTSAVLARLIPTSAVHLHLFWAEFTWHRVARLPRVDALSEPAGFNLPASLWRKQLAYALLHEGVCPAMRQLYVPLYEVVSLPWNPQLGLPQPLYSPLR